MALEKELINGKGVKTTYHRIDSISMVDGIEVTVKSYTDESYRQQEKERESLIEGRKKSKSSWKRKWQKQERSTAKKKVIALTEENNEIGFPVPLDLSILYIPFNILSTKKQQSVMNLCIKVKSKSPCLKMQSMYWNKIQHSVSTILFYN